MALDMSANIRPPAQPIALLGEEAVDLKTIAALRTCVYHQPGIDLLFEVIDLDNILFGSEMVGAVRGIDPETGFYFDDTKRYIDALDLTDAERHQIYESNARRVYPRHDAQLKERGL